MSRTARSKIGSRGMWLHPCVPRAATEVNASMTAEGEASDKCRPNEFEADVVATEGVEGGEVPEAFG